MSFNSELNFSRRFDVLSASSSFFPSVHFHMRAHAASGRGEGEGTIQNYFKRASRRRMIVRIRCTPRLGSVSRRGGGGTAGGAGADAPRYPWKNYT